MDNGTSTISITTTQPERWKFCPSCATKIKAKWKFCAECGHQVGHCAAPFVAIPQWTYTTAYGPSTADCGSASVLFGVATN